MSVRHFCAAFPPTLSHLMLERAFAGLARPLATAPAGVPLEELPNGDVRVRVALGATVVIFSGDAAAPPPFVVAPLAGNVTEYNWWGKRVAGGPR